MASPGFWHSYKEVVGGDLRFFFIEKCKVPTYRTARRSACGQLKQRLKTGPGHRGESAHPVQATGSTS